MSILYKIKSLIFPSKIFRILCEVRLIFGIFLVVTGSGENCVGVVGVRGCILSDKNVWFYCYFSRVLLY